jgi:hypothetical protein
VRIRAVNNVDEIAAIAHALPSSAIVVKAFLTFSGL